MLSHPGPIVKWTIIIAAVVFTLAGLVNIICPPHSTDDNLQTPASISTFDNGNDAGNVLSFDSGPAPVFTITSATLSAGGLAQNPILSGPPEGMKTSLSLSLLKSRLC